MFKGKDYIGLSYDGEVLKVARIKPEGKSMRILQLDKLSLIKPLKSSPNGMKSATTQAEADPFDDFDDIDEIDNIDDLDLDDDLDSEEIFGLDEDDEESEDLLDEIDLSDIDDDFGGDDDLDLVDETSAAPDSNEMLIYEYLQNFGKKKKHIALNITSGDAVFQLISEGDFKKMKRKEIQESVEEKLNSIYGDLPHEDLYSYYVRDDGTLIIGSVDHESPVLRLLNDTKAEYGEKYFISDLVADESIMVALYNTHYEPEENEITGLLQIGPEKCRMLFMQGEKVLQISPVINEGTNNKSYLNTIFSKILFQLDTGEIPGLDKLILFNNVQGDKSIDFFRTSFSDLIVENFQFNTEKILYDEELESALPGFSTAIGLASLAAKNELRKHIQTTFLPKYVAEQQKIFKLQWHGFILLFLIGASPMYLNHQYQKNATEIENLQLQSDRITSSINELQPAVAEFENLTQQMGLMQNQIELLTELSEDNIRWTTTIDHFNRVVNETGGLWINSFRQNNDVIMVDGYSLQQRRIPELANKFETVTLLNVRRQDIREREVFFFTMMIREVIGDKSLYTPRMSRDFQEQTDQ